MLNISIENLKKDFDFQQLADEVELAIQKYASPDVLEQVQYHLRLDDLISVSLKEKYGLLEIGLDDPTMIIIFVSLKGKLELLGLALNIVEHFVSQHSGECDKEEWRYLQYLHRVAETNQIDWTRFDPRA